MRLRCGAGIGFHRQKRRRALMDRFLPAGISTVRQGQRTAWRSVLSGSVRIAAESARLTRIPLNWNPVGEYVTVLSGRVQLGMGSSVDVSEAQSYSPGDFVFIPARKAHWAQARGATVLQVRRERTVSTKPWPHKIATRD